MSVAPVAIALMPGDSSGAVTRTAASCVSSKSFYLVVQPDRCTFRPYIGGDRNANANTARLVDLRWVRWGRKRTQATGTYVSQKGSRSPATVTLARRRTCHATIGDGDFEELRIYERFVIRVEGEVIAAGRGYLCIL